jgi:hypothetical protein
MSTLNRAGAFLLCVFLHIGSPTLVAQKWESRLMLVENFR